ncbi:methyltransferase type 11 [Mycolicibacterium tokaiense]|uniref:Methyltransferase type 11 n=2 Tax=Mycolicibacterium tokaiense TaxID=39695 RepID=A0A379PLR1_9MYCO|nr:methyltransferase type 11 [Mycolicibacterium tokaiense]
MLMNRAETALINSPPRRWLQRLYEVPVLLSFGGRLPPGSRALEIGCGSGYGSQLMLQRFGAAQVDAIDLDPAMIARAQARLAPYRDRVHLATGSATDLRAALNADDGSYDAVFDFGIIHHISDWRGAVAEAARVLSLVGGSTSKKSLHTLSTAPPTGGCSTTPPRTGLPPRTSSTR